MGSKTTQKTEIPPPTEQEKQLMQMTLDAMMPAYLDQMGFEVQKNTVNWDQSDEGKRFLQEQQNIQSQITNLQSAPGSTYQEENQKQQQLQQLQARLDSINSKIDDARKNNPPYTTYTSRKKLDPELESIRSEYGEDSQQFKDAKKASDQQAVRKKQQQDQIDSLIMDKAQRFLSSDFSMNDNEKKFFDETIGPVKEAVANSVKYLQDEANNSNQSISKAIDDFSTQVKQTGMNMEDAVLSLEDRIKTTGVNLKDALKEEVDLSKNLMQMGLQDFTRDERKRVATQAAALGRSPSDPEFQKQLQDSVDREIQRTGLQLDQYAADKRLGIEERTGSALESAQQLRMGIAERTGSNLESAAQAKMGLAERTAGLREEAARTAGAGGVNVAQMGSNLRSQLTLGMPVTQIGTGLNVDQVNQALLQQRLSNAAAAVNAPMSLYETMAKERFAQPTVTTKKTPGALEIIGGIAGLGLSAAGMATGAGWIGGAGSAVGGAAGWAGGKAGGF